MDVLEQAVLSVDVGGFVLEEDVRVGVVFGEDAVEDDGKHLEEDEQNRRENLVSLFHFWVGFFAGDLRFII